MKKDNGKDSKAKKESREFQHFSDVEMSQTEYGLNQGHSFRKIAKAIGRCVSSVIRHVMSNLKWEGHNSCSRDCTHSNDCRYVYDHEHCQKGVCADYEPTPCDTRDKKFCNGCPRFSRCGLSKKVYRAEFAIKNCRKKAKARYAGAKVSDKELKRIYDIIAPLIKKGFSPYLIVTKYKDELGISESTLYNYLEKDAFARIDKSFGESWRKRKHRKPKETHEKKNRDWKFLDGRRIEDYEEYEKTHEIFSICYMDTVFIGGRSVYLQTFFLEKPGLLLAFYHKRKTAEEMVAGMNALEELLGRELFKKYAYVVITDRGTEFTDVEGLEHSPDGAQRSLVFYCDPGCPGQKWAIENAHGPLRDIFPRDLDVDAVKLDQKKVNKAISVLNSKPRKNAFDTCTFDYVEVADKELLERLKAHGIKKVDRDKLNFTPDLLKDDDDEGNNGGDAGDNA